jgi:hypothetical protein
MQSNRASRVKIKAAVPPMMVPIIRPTSAFGVGWVGEEMFVVLVLPLVAIPMNGVLGVLDGLDVVVLTFELVELEMVELIALEIVELVASTPHDVLGLIGGGGRCMLLEISVAHDRTVGEPPRFSMGLDVGLNAGNEVSETIVDVVEITVSVERRVDKVAITVGFVDMTSSVALA